MNRKSKLLFYITFTACMILSVVFVYQNHALYNQTIAQVIDTSLTDTKNVSDQYDNTDKVYQQELTAKIKNGAQKGKQIKLKNEYSDSGAYDQPYQTGTEVFVAIDQDKSNNETLSGSITGVKRDKYTLVIAWIFTIALMVVGKKQGLFATLSLAVNIILLSYALDVYVKTGVYLLWICGLLVILFTVISLLLVNGFNEKTYAAIISTLTGTFSSLLLTYLAMEVTSENGLLYEEMQFLTRPYAMVFLGGLFIGSLGAVMDVAISISAGIFELYEKNKHINIATLKASGFNIGKDIMGTMTNILFFAYISGSIPMLILYFTNRSPLGFSLSINLSLELARALAGGIGIVLTIPIAIYVSIFFIHRKKANV